MPAAEVESLRKSLSIYKGLVEVSGLINSITDYDELLRAILDVARRVILAEAASLFFVNKETGALELAITSSGQGQFIEPRISVPRGKGIAGWVLAHAQSILIPNAYADARFYKEADLQTGFQTRSILCAPLKHEGEIIGVLQILNPRDRDSFDEQDFEGFTAYANLTATAIGKLRALERMRAQERVERDLAIASDIQQEILARAIPARTPGALFAAHNQAASNVGGDFYNVFVRSPYETYFAVGRRLRQRHFRFSSDGADSERDAIRLCHDDQPCGCACPIELDAKRPHHPRHVRDDDRGPRYPFG